MKRMLATVSVAALASIGFVGSAQAAPADAACFGQIHKAVNTAGALDDVDNVGQFVQASRSDETNGGQAKKAAVDSLFC